ncbi:hypothetical protein [Patulibacter minatonensis]|uniref:hypothetical protein n=1 Tax=Patulibacter minatonensis TaxID=298163 RepID=UPI00047C19F3|nr:hypothetical protein [Patulibacter minatonensis]
MASPRTRSLPIALAAAGAVAVLAPSADAAQFKTINCSNPASSPISNYIQKGAELPNDSCLQSLNGRYRAKMQGDGNFAIYGQVTGGWNARWSAGSNRTAVRGNYVRVGNDGNVVIYGAKPQPGVNGAVACAFNVAGKGVARLALLDDGTLQAQPVAGASLWNSGLYPAPTGSCIAADGTTPPEPAPDPTPTPTPPAAGLPAAWSRGPVNAPTWKPAKKKWSSITCGLSAIPAGLAPESVRNGFTPRSQAIIATIKAAPFNFASVGGGASNGKRSGHVSNSFHYCGRGLDSYAKGAKSGKRQTGATLASSWKMANWAAHNAPALNIAQVIFMDRIWTADKGGWRPYTNDGLKNAKTESQRNTLQHRDHVHLSVF